MVWFPWLVGVWCETRCARIIAAHSRECGNPVRRGKASWVPAAARTSGENRLVSTRAKARNGAHRLALRLADRGFCERFERARLIEQRFRLGKDRVLALLGNAH